MTWTTQLATIVHIEEARAFKEWLKTPEIVPLVEATQTCGTPAGQAMAMLALLDFFRDERKRMRNGLTER